MEVFFRGNEKEEEEEEKEVKEKEVKEKEVKEKERKMKKEVKEKEAQDKDAGVEEGRRCDVGEESKVVTVSRISGRICLYLFLSF